MRRHRDQMHLGTLLAWCCVGVLIWLPILSMVGVL